MAASDVELPALSLPSPVRPTQQLPPLQVDAAVKDQILRELKVQCLRHQFDLPPTTPTTTHHPHLPHTLPTKMTSTSV